ncbi:putative ribonuclease H-like domain-containing protein [Tanacetum coccineum]|uniref:Ribonuclease H-like domain-containing protein n=1 Tax=Tanacetum coccineum TaxID=301880 RepID=A0ABQ5DGT0_9ASTR
MDNVRPRTLSFSPSTRGNQKKILKDYAIIDSGCSGSMTGNKDKLSDFKEFKGGYKGKRKRLLYKKIEERTVREPLELLHMDLFGPVSVESVNRKKYCLVVTDDCSVTGTDVQESIMIEFLCQEKGIKREYSIATGTPQQMVLRKKNGLSLKQLRIASRTSLLPIQFWAEAVNTACYVLNRVLVTKPQMKTPYEILMGRSPKHRTEDLLDVSKYFNT